jgi:hypothetical protein
MIGLARVFMWLTGASAALVLVYYVSALGPLCNKNLLKSCLEAMSFTFTDPVLARTRIPKIASPIPHEKIHNCPLVSQRVSKGIILCSSQS